MRLQADLQKEPDRAVAEIKGIDVEYGEHRHGNHEQQVSQSETQSKHGGVNCGCPAEHGGEDELAVFAAHICPRFEVVALCFDQTEGIKIYCKNVNR